ncbi:MAG: alpha/beta hydrolase-fold protein [Ferruginibacter sp.]
MPRFITICLLFGLISCKSRVKQSEDELYSRHLQEHVKLTIITTALPDDKSTINLLLLNDGQDIEKLRVKDIVDSLSKKKLIQPLLIVAIHAGKRMQEYGVAGNPDYQHNGADAEKYSAFIDDELLAFAKKKAGVRKFNTITIAGCSLGGLSAFDFAWNHGDKVDKVGVFSGSFWLRDKDAKDPSYNDETDRLEYAMIKSSRKRPKLQYWFYAGTAEENGDRDKDGIIDVVDDTKDMIALLQTKNVSSADIVYKETAGGRHDYSDWAAVFPEFLIWAVGK